MQSIRKVALIIAGSICLALGAVGVFVPVLPTTPFVLLAAFLYSRSSSRLNSWLASTSIYRAYVEPFKQSGGISMQRKLRIVLVSFAVMAISALLVRKLIVWIVLAAVAVFLLVLMFGKIPTISKEEERSYGALIDASQDKSAYGEDWHARALGVTGSRRVRRCEALNYIGNCHHQAQASVWAQERPKLTRSAQLRQLPRNCKIPSTS